MRPSTRRILVALPVILAALGLAPAVAASDAASPVQQRILELFFIILVFALIIGVLVHVIILAAVQWYKDSPRWRAPKGHPRTHDRRLELGWTVGPVLILAAVVAVTWVAIPFVERPAHYDYAIEVIGAQWAWRFHYPSPFVFPNGTNATVPESSGTMYIQQGVTFLLLVRSNDVNHAFYVPDLGIKIDAIPGRTNIFWVQATRPGTYTVQCAEFCGLGHSQMHGEVVVFRPGTRAIPYGPPPSTVQSDFGSPKYTIVDIAFKESPGSCNEGQWSIQPCAITLGSNFNVTFRVWNNESGTHLFEIATTPTGIIGPAQEPKTPHEPVFINFNTGPPGQYAFWCNIPGHRGLGMEGILNVTGPRTENVLLRDNSISPSEIEAPLGTSLSFAISNVGTRPHNFSVGPPYDTRTQAIPSGGNATITLVLNRTASAAPYGDLPGIAGTLRVITSGRVTPPPPPPAGFPVVEVTFGLAGLAAAAAILFNFKLARDVRRRQRLPPEEE